MNREMLEMELFECIVLHIADNETTAGEEDGDNTQHKYVNHIYNFPLAKKNAVVL